MNTENTKTTQFNRFRVYLTEKLDFRGNKTIALANLSIYHTWQNVKSEYKNNKFKLIGITWETLKPLIYQTVLTQLLIFFVHY